MSVVAIILALLIEQWRPLGEHKGVSSTLAAWAGSLERSFNGGAREHGLTAWLVAVLPPVAISILLHALLSAANWLLALAFDIAVLYLTLGFRQFSHYFTDIQLALKSGDIDRARRSWTSGAALPGWCARGRKWCVCPSRRRCSLRTAMSSACCSGT